MKVVNMWADVSGHTCVMDTCGFGIMFLPCKQAARGNGRGID